MADLHNQIAEELRRKIANGEATASDLNVARQFLKDNGIESVPTPDNGVGNLAKELPFETEEQD